MVEKYYGVGDNIEAFIAAPVGALDTTITVDDATVFSAIDLPCVVTVSPVSDSVREKMKIVSVDSGTTLTVERAFQDAAIAHSIGDVMQLRVIKEHIQDLYDNAIMRIGESCYIEHVKNGSQQVTTTNVYEDSGKTQLLCDIAYTYSDTLVRTPSTATRIIYKDDGSTWRTETTTFTVNNGEISVVERVIS